jgi:hydrogenase nickel incorporation protein HypA/HybF
LSHSWEIVVFGTPFEGVPLVVREVPAVIECRACGTHTELDDPIFRCGSCGSVETTVVSGDEMLVTSLDLTVDAL